MKHLPNALTALRLVLSLFVFFALATAAAPSGAGASWPNEGFRSALRVWAFAAFVVAAVTDFFDGWLARRHGAVSVAGAILDPIADKVLICAAVLGLIALQMSPVVIPGGLILFREFAVSALREVAAGRGVKLPVTLLAKWKTTLQLVALGVGMIVAAWPPPAVYPDPGILRAAATLAFVALLWIACVVTLITGAQYGFQAWRALSSAPAAGPSRDA